jgi:hypothetical protein
LAMKTLDDSRVFRPSLGSWWALAVSLVLSGLPALGERPSAPAGPPSLQKELQALKEAYPNRARLVKHFQEAAGRLLKLIGAEGQLAEGPEGADQARFLASEILFLGGDTTGGRALLEELAGGASSGEHRAMALYLLGDYYFHRSLYLSQAAEKKRARDKALETWKTLCERHPASGWCGKVALPLRYLELRGGGAAPAFREKFRSGDEEKEYSLEDLKGKVLVLDFWRGSTPGQEDFEKHLARDLLKILEEFPALKGRVVVLGVNLDARSGDFQAAVKEWAIPWPQHHDGLGFETPLAGLFAIPSEPHWAVVSPEGKVAFLGSDDEDAFRRALSDELQRLTGKKK